VYATLAMGLSLSGVLLSIMAIISGIRWVDRQGYDEQPVLPRIFIGCACVAAVLSLSTLATISTADVIVPASEWIALFALALIAGDTWMSISFFRRPTRQ
jgi:hypothetical protein